MIFLAAGLKFQLRQFSTLLDYLLEYKSTKKTQLNNHKKNQEELAARSLEVRTFAKGQFAKFISKL